MKRIFAVALLLMSFTSVVLAEGDGKPPSAPSGSGQGPVTRQ